jgi:hypothetical protein
MQGPWEFNRGLLKTLIDMAPDYSVSRLNEVQIWNACYFASARF